MAETIPYDGGMDHLYVMQNEFGFIKIGRSNRVEQRRRALEKTDLCSIRLVASFDDHGHLEEALHLTLDEHRLIGEWFYGDAPARAAIIAAMGLPAGQIWPYPETATVKANGWLDRLEDERANRASIREFGRLALEMERHPCQSDKTRFYDVQIWTVLTRGLHRVNTVVESKVGRDGVCILVGHRSDSDAKEPLPFYTRDIDAALAVWPVVSRPDAWSGMAWDCCIDGLRAQRDSLSSKK